MAISAAQLDVAFEKLKGAGETDADAQDSISGWHDVRVKENFGIRYLRISRLLPSSPQIAGTSEGLEGENGEGDEVVEEDDQVLTRPSGDERGERDGGVEVGGEVVYEVVHSPIYCVPVLYVNVTARSGARASPETVYDLLVPRQFKTQVKDVGVMGALSMTDHPITGLPTYFVHPCRTQEAMSAVSRDDEEESERYLMRWMGVIGASVGLIVPTGVALRLGARKGELGER